MNLPNAPSILSDLPAVGTFGLFSLLTVFYRFVCFFVLVVVPRFENLQALFTECHGTRGMYAIQLHC